MPFKAITPQFSVSPQLTESDIKDAAAQGFRSIICNRPDNEEPGQPDANSIQGQAAALGLAFAYIPVTPADGVTAANAADMCAALDDLPAPVLAYCRSGARSGKIWDAAQAAAPKNMPSQDGQAFDVVIVGGGSAGIATASSLLKRNAASQYRSH